jgi:TolB-like protein
MRDIILRAGLLSFCCAVASVHPSFAQCPDGSPPPCARAAGGRAASAPANTIAVLYFDNLSRDSSDAYLADGLTDEIIVRLQHIARLDVKSRYEVRRLRATNVSDARSVGRELRVAWIVTGSVRPSPSRMRVSYELVRTSDGRSVVSDIIDTTAADQWAISSAVSTSIARGVAGELAPAEAAALARGTRDAQAVDLYRRAMYLYNRGLMSNRFDALMSIAFFRAAIERDSGYADAWAGMANAWGYLDGIFPNRVVAENGRTAGQRALALDSTVGAGAAAILYALSTVDYDWAGAERFGRRALELSPRSAPLLQIQAAWLASVGQLDAAEREIMHAWAVDSLDPGNSWVLMGVLGSERKFDAMLRLAPRMRSNQANVRFWGISASARRTRRWRSRAPAHAARSPSRPRAAWTKPVRTSCGIRPRLTACAPAVTSPVMPTCRPWRGPRWATSIARSPLSRSATACVPGPT